MDIWLFRPKFGWFFFHQSTWLILLEKCVLRSNFRTCFNNAANFCGKNFILMFTKFIWKLKFVFTNKMFYKHQLFAYKKSAVFFKIYFPKINCLFTKNQLYVYNKHHLKKSQTIYWTKKLLLFWNICAEKNWTLLLKHSIAK